MVQSRKRMNRKQKGGEVNCSDYCSGSGNSYEDCCKAIKAQESGEENKDKNNEIEDLSLHSYKERKMVLAPGNGGKRRTRKAKKSKKQRKTKGGKKTAKKGKKSYKKKSTRRRH